MSRWSAVLALVGALTLSIGPPAPRRPAPEQLSHEWRLIDGKHWQIVSQDAVEEADVTDASEGTRGGCAEGMVKVQGPMLVQGSGYFDAVEALQKSACASWINRTFPERCARFDEERWRVLSARIPRQSMRFCIDRFEYPNRRGAYPWIMVNWNEARGICAREGKRLCTEAEWTFACEGEEATPYPYGYQRDPEACVIDRPWRAYRAEALFPRGTERARAELDRLWQGEASGARPHCRSPFGVYDMTGNVDEWTTCVERRSKCIVRRFRSPVPVLCLVPTGFLHLESGGRRVESGGRRVESGGKRVEAGNERVEAGGERAEFGGTGLTTHRTRPKSRAISTIFNSGKRSGVQSPIGFGHACERYVNVEPGVGEVERGRRAAPRSGPTLAAERGAVARS